MFDRTSENLAGALAQAFGVTPPPGVASGKTSIPDTTVAERAEAFQGELAAITGIKPVAPKAAQAGAETGTDDQEKNASLLAQIRDKGFKAYAEDLQQQKMEELRAKLLDAMGLSEEGLAKLPAEQRNTIEQVIAEEIKNRLTASGEVNAPTRTKGSQNANPFDFVRPGTANLGNGMAILLATQETANAAPPGTPPRTSSFNPLTAAA